MITSPKSRLDSWKEIADYLGREVRTVIRWEKDKSLPVHRVPGGKRRAVFAYTEEIDAWLAAGRITSAGWPEASGKASRSEPRPRSMWALRVAFIVVVLGLALVPLVSSYERKHLPRLAAVALRGNKLVAFNEQGGVSWGVDLPLPPKKLLASQVIPRSLVTTHRERVLVSLRTEPEGMPARSDEIQLLSATGKRMWKLVPQSTFHFGPLEAGPPWEFQDWSVVNGHGRFMVAVAMSQPKQRQSMVFLADAQGKIVGRYVDSGSITTLRTIRRPTAPLLLAGGASRSANRAVLAVLDVNHFKGSSPDPVDSAYSCNDCSPGRPLQYFAFPRSELNQIAGPAANRVKAIEIGRGAIEVRTTEAVLYGETAEAVYEFSRDLELRRTSFNKAYWHIHRELEVAGKISHPQDSCPDRNGPPSVRVWTADAGWSSMRPPPITAASF